MTEQEETVTSKERIIPFDLLPDEIWLRIFSELPVSALCRCRRVSKKWNSLSHDQSIWQCLCKNILPASFLAKIKPIVTAKEEEACENDSTATATFEKNNKLSNSFKDCTSWENTYRVYSSTQQNWATSTAVRVTSVKAHEQSIKVLKLKGDLVVTGSSDNYTRVWSVRTMERLLEIDVEADVNSIDFLVEKDVIVCGSYYGEFGCKLFSFSRGKFLGQFMENHWVGTQCLSMNEDYIVLGAHNGDIYVIAWSEGRKVAVFNEHRNPVAGVCLIGADTILSVSTNGTIDTFSIKQHTRLHQYSISNGMSVCISAFDEFSDGRNVMCVSPTGTIVHLVWPNNETTETVDSSSQDFQIIDTESIHRIFSQDPIIHYSNTEISNRILCAAIDGNFNRGVIGQCLSWPPRGSIQIYDFEKGLGRLDGIQRPNAEDDALGREQGSNPVFTTLGMDIEKVVAGCSRGWMYCFELVGEVNKYKEEYIRENQSTSSSPLLKEIWEEIY
ncbi:10010_t:CDS:2 [Ambispora leptoticha]|uniref:10010_t:CDS:1 n=1 Tax=Ambispora leptoticha TaxID=144679 RepID=A0A9N8YTX1_9GLOM|nr:10010_t:CDS:2 [Ambispora leptoticha]